MNLNISNLKDSGPIMELDNNTPNNLKISINDKNKFNEDNFFINDISNNSEEIKKKYLDNSDIKNKNGTDKNDIFSSNGSSLDKSNNNTLEGSLNKKLYDSQNPINDENPKLTRKKHNIFFPNEGKNFSLNNSQNQSIIKKKIPNQSDIIKHYKRWKGDNYFPLKANLIEGPCSFRPTLMTGCAMTLPTLLYIIFNSDYISEKLTVLIPIIIFIIYIITLIYLIIASFCDPGIIRRFDIPNNEAKKDKNNYLNEFKRNEAKIFHLGYLVNYKYCPSCGIIRPNRSTHCSDCNNCVERLDHHCPWIGNCAGKRNYAYFFIFLTLLNILSILIIIFCIIHIVKKNKDFKKEGKTQHLTALSFCDSIIALYLIIYCLLSMCFITGLFFYHSKLILNNATTKELLKNVFNKYQGNPYKRNISTNIKNVLFPKIKKYSILDILRGDIKEICDYKKKDNNKNNTNNSIKINIIENNNKNEYNTNEKLNVKPMIDKKYINDNSQLKGIDSNINNINNDTDNIVLMHNNMSKSNLGEEKESSNNSKNNLVKSFFKEGIDETDFNRKINNSHQKSKRSHLTYKNNNLRNYKLEQYLKYFGTGKTSKEIYK